MAQERVTLVEYSPEWPLQFSAEARAIVSAFAADRVCVEHIGSTAVAGLDAKPIIDILLGAESLAQIESHIPDLERIGYRYISDFEDQLPQRRYFVKPDRADARFHVHAVELGGSFWRDHLRFRNMLRDDAAVREQYRELKRKLAAAFRNDRAGYTDAKASFIRNVLIERLPTLDDLRHTLESLGIALPGGTTRVGAFGDSPELSEQLLSLIRNGTKRATASLLWAYEADAEPVPAPGDVEVAVDRFNEPSVVTRVIEVEIVPFNEVREEFAAREGEGDGSLAYWREAHWAFFSRECKRLGRTPREVMPVVCVTFEVLHVLDVRDRKTP
jgi:GrpB-like predicted nucleotidyltransferase (UPF0157 family)/uncharacterized protein YhfF